MTTKKKNELYDVSADLDTIFGAPGTESRKKAEDIAWQEYNAQILLDARKNAGLTQEALAERIGASKGYISRLERGLTVPTIATFYRIISAMGLTIELKPIS
ncbi:MAG: helix-turn-helix domain-containing protein [Bacteroidaceae bacterium]|nr:helix-turn-helix domain-containing protein [Bacteroidaceae bacterium]